MSESAQRASGLGAAANRVWLSLLEGVYLRLELLETEIHEEKRRLVATVFLTGLAFFFAAMVFLCLNLLLLMHFWEQRVLVVWCMTAAYLAMALLAWWQKARRTRRDQPAFHATREVLEEDRKAFRSRSE